MGTERKGSVDVAIGVIKTPEKLFSTPGRSVVAFIEKNPNGRDLHYSKVAYTLAENGTEVYMLPVLPEYRDMFDYDYVVTDGKKVCPVKTEWVILKRYERLKWSEWSKKVDLALEMLKEFSLYTGGVDSGKE